MRQQYVRAISQLVEGHRQEIISFTQSIVRTPSITGNEEACAIVIKQKMEELGLSVDWIEPEKGRPNVLGSWKGKRPGGQFLFNGHIDTVPPGPLDEWKYDPFSGVIEDGSLYGRGALDMKGGLACMIMAAGLFNKLELDIPGSILVTTVCDEQVGSNLGTRFLIKEGYIKADMAIVGEPTDMRINIGHKGIYWGEIITRGKAIHASRPWLGINAVDHMYEIMGQIELLKEKLGNVEPDPWLGKPTVAVTMFEGGTTENMIPSRCRLVLDRRLVYGEDDRKADGEVAECIKNAKKIIPDLNATTSVLKYKPTGFVDPGSPIVGILKDAATEVTGVSPEIKGKSGGTDASWIVNHAGIPAIIFGPGEYLKASLAANEFVGIEDLITATKVYMLTAAKALQFLAT